MLLGLQPPAQPVGWPGTHTEAAPLLYLKGLGVHLPAPQAAAADAMAPALYLFLRHTRNAPFLSRGRAGVMVVLKRLRCL